MSLHPATVAEAIELGINPDTAEGDELDLRTAVEDAKQQRNIKPKVASKPKEVSNGTKST